MKIVSSRWLYAAALAAPVFTSCGAAPKAPVAMLSDAEMATPASATAAAPARAFVPGPRQDDDAPYSQIHPNAMITLSGLVGSQDVEINRGPALGGVASGSGDTTGARLRGEYIFGESNLGVHLSLGATDSSDLDSEPDRKTTAETSSVFLGFVYRAVMDDDFRMPVRIGPVAHSATVKADGAPDGDTTFDMTGLRLSAEPELVLSMRTANGKVTSELSAYVEVACSNGGYDAKDNVDKESGYAFQLQAEVGVRYRFLGGLLGGLSYVMQKTNYGATDSYNNPTTVFNGIDDDINGVMLTFGARF